MSIADQIRALETLASIDAELKTLDDQITLERTTLNGLKAQVKKLDDRLAVDRASLAALEKTRNEHVHDVRNMNQQLEHSRDKLGRARTERESNAAQREMEELRKLVRDREEEAGKLTTEIDALRKQVEGTEEEHGKLAQELADREGDISARLVDVEAQRAEKGATRDAASKALPAALYRRYDMIRGKRGFAIAQTTDGTCKACNMSLPPQMFHRLRREPMLEQCPSCNRIIYFAAPAAPRPA